MTQAATGRVNGTGVAATGADDLPDVAGVQNELRSEESRANWFTRLVVYYLRRHQAERERERAMGAAGARVEAGHETDRAHAAIRRACIKSAITGAATGALST